MTWIKSVAWQTGMPSWPPRRTECHLSSWRATKDPGRCERPYAGGCDHLLEARVHGREVINIQQPCRKKGQSSTSVNGRRTRQRQALCFEFSPQIVWSKSARWPVGVASCLRSRKRTPPSFWPTTRPHGGGGCSHQDAAQVHDGRVIKFVPIPIKTKTSSASMNSGKMLQRDTAGVLCRERNTAPLEKKQLQVWVRHQAAGRCHTPPPTTSNECSHELLSGIERGLILSSGEVRLRPHAPFPPVCRSRRAKHEGPRMRLRYTYGIKEIVVRATKGAQNIIRSKEREG